ncbi:hypothetical protein ACO0LO_08760 [Undibacterium sp. TJN25]|uniref:hypothetical protein n=1 Tax=Undibacterium sp. TJN25 TaxID=3413056 RepID=UPI003BF3D720
MNAKILGILALPVLISACAGPVTAEDDTKEEKVYTTGSLLPQRGASAASQVSKEELEAKRNQTNSVQMRKPL